MSNGNGSIVTLGLSMLRSPLLAVVLVLAGLVASYRVNAARLTEAEQRIERMEQEQKTLSTKEDLREFRQETQKRFDRLEDQLHGTREQLLERIDRLKPGERADKPTWGKQ